METFRDMACVMHFPRLETFGRSRPYDPEMGRLRRWVLNRLASLTPACRLSDYSAARIKTSPASREQARKRQSSDRRNRRNHITGILILLLTLAILRKIA
jgi:hypothetical protein